MKLSKIKSFEITGLFGTNDIKIPFESDIKILIGENGIGKTQVLNLFYCILTQNFFRLHEFNFHELKLTFSDDEDIRISKSDIEELVDTTYKSPIIKDLISELGFAQFELLRSKFSRSGKSRNRMYSINEDYGISSKIGRKFPINRLMRAFEELEVLEEESNITILEDCKNLISSELRNLEILYFPTYRRVEEDLHNLGYEEDELSLNHNNNLMQFGMDDVQKRFNSIENTIDKLLKEGLAQFTKDILNVVIDEDELETSENILNKIDQDDIEIILSRVGNLLPDNQKEAVKNIVANKKLKNPLHAYLLRKLIDIYEKQKEIDASVKIFRDVCNKYLIDKKIFYDESAIKIYIKSDITDSKISLNRLSSGEKQIISIFSKVYLSDSDKEFIILFDEPELSLSMTWQKQLLPDILDSKKCNFLLAVTHSPFIFDNETDPYAVGLSTYIRQSSLI